MFLRRNLYRGGGIIYGVAFGENYRVEYIRGCICDDVDRMRGSKYVDAFMPDDLINAFLEDVGSGKRILFSGTSCQLAGMKAILREQGLKDDNVCWVDFYGCAGKVSSRLWEKECETYRKIGDLQEVSFRDKTNGWKTYSMCVKISGKRHCTDFLCSRWSKFLGSGLCTRQACLNCLYVRGRGGADISIGDFWDRIALPKKWRDNKGLSVVQVNTAKGAALFEYVKENRDYMEVQLDDKAKEGNRKYIDYAERRKFWSVFNAQGYEECCKQYAHITWKEKMLFGKIRPILIRMGLR